MKPAISLCLFAASLLPAAAFADTSWIPAGEDDWFLPGNWSNGVPGSGSSAEIVNNGAALIASGAAVVDVLTLGSSNGNGALSVTGGVLSAGTITLGAEAGGNGSLSITGGVVQASQIVKGAGTGLITLNGGTLRAMADQPDYLSGLALNVGSPAYSTIDTNGFDIGLSNVHEDSIGSFGGTLHKIGDGTLSLSGDDTPIAVRLWVETAVLRRELLTFIMEPAALAFTFKLPEQ